MSAERARELTALVIAARDGEPEAQDALVSAYLPLVYNVVGRALNGSVDVDDVVQETMLRSLDALGSLRDPESFRSWLVAIAMNQVRAHWHDRQSAPGAVEEAVDLADPGADFVDLTMVQLQLSGQRQETARATRWLEPEDRGLLSLWWLECAGELTRAEVAAALELSPQHTAVRVQRMKAQLEAARVVVRALDAQPPCAELRGMLGTWDGRPSALWRKRIARHARGCGYCSGLWSGLMPAEGLLAGLALVAATPGLLDRVLGASDAMAPVGSASPHTETAHHAGSGGGAEVPAAGARAVSRGEARRRRRVKRRAVGGAVVAACVAGGGLWYFDSDSGTGTDEPAAARTAAAVADASETRPVDASPSASVSKSPSPKATPSKKPKPSKTAKPTKKATPTARPSTPRPDRDSAGTPQTQAAPAGTVAQVVALVNQERASAGCGPVTEDPLLNNSSQAHSADMDARDFFDHTNPDGEDPGQRITAAGYRWSTYGENIAMGQQTPQAVMDSWMNSPGHRANILNCSFKNIGVGVHKGSGGPWWTQNFGAKL